MNLPRRPKKRLVEFVPDIRCFKPVGIPLRKLQEITLGIDELESLRLKDIEGLSQHDCAQRMNLAQSTFQRILASARNKVTRALVHGCVLRIDGGRYEVVART